MDDGRSAAADQRERTLRLIRAFGPPEPYRVKMVEPIPTSTSRQRAAWIEEAGYNLFKLPAECVALDLLTDSGTGAMSHHQWSAMLQADESYAGARSYYRLEATVRDVFGLPQVIPTHQGRAAEHLLFAELIEPGQIVLSNTCFDTTRANGEAAGATVIDLPAPESLQTGVAAPFKGNVDLQRLEEHLASAAKGEIGCVVLTLTNNAGGGQPVAVRNVQAASALCRRHGVPLVLDVCRIAENAFFVQEREEGYQETPIAEIVRAIADRADILTMSAKKDGLTNIGGFIALRDPALAERIRRRMVVTEGFPTYGGLAGRDLEAMAVGLREALDPSYLGHRVGQVRFLADLLRGLGIPLVEPPGGHGVFVDATDFLHHLPRSQFPGQALAVALYRESGVRSCEIGAVMFGDEAGPDVHDLVRLAIPRRTYTNAQLARVADAFAAIQDRRATVPGMRIVDEPPVLRHFTARFALVERSSSASTAA